MNSDRITRADLERIAATVSDSLPLGQVISAQGRNGYIGLDHYDDAAMLDTLFVGTRRECYTYLQGMRRAQLLAPRRAGDL